MNSVEDLDESRLGQAGLVYEHVLSRCLNPQSVTILLKAPNKHTLQQTKVNT